MNVKCEIFSIGLFNAG